MGGTEADWPKIDYIFQHESSWKTSNPNMWDVNAAAGNPSDGLGQLTLSNRKQYGSGPDAYSQTTAAIKYMRDRYGSIDGAYQYWLGHHNYATGGSVGADSPCLQVPGVQESLRGAQIDTIAVTEGVNQAFPGIPWEGLYRGADF